MACQKIANRLGKRNWRFAALILPILLCQPALGQTSNTGTLEELIRSYEVSSYLEAPNIARGLTRELRTTPKTNETRLLRARAMLALSTQAAVEDRKGLALSKAREALGLIEALPSDSPLRAQGAIALARAQLLHEDYIPALTTIADARRAYGFAREKDDVTREELNLWAGIIKTQAPDWLSEQILRFKLNEEANQLEDNVSNPCGGAYGRFRRDSSVGTEPNYPIVSMFDGRTGGVMLRLKLDQDGRVLNARSTAFVPRPGFAAAAEVAALTWQFNLPPNIPAACREDVPFLVSFKFR